MLVRDAPTAALRTRTLADADPQNFFLDRRTDSGSLVDEILFLDE